MNNSIQKNYIIRYIMLKIQWKEWEANFKIPSERWFAMKFNVSKTLVNQVLSILKKQNVIYSKASVGNFVNGEDTSFLWNTNHIFTDIKIQKLSRNINKQELLIIKKIAAQDKKIIFDNAFNKNITIYKKTYYINKGDVSKIVYAYFWNKFNVNKTEEEQNLELAKISLYKYAAYLGMVLTNTIIAYGFEENHSINTKHFIKYDRDTLIASDCKLYYDEHKKPQLFIKVLHKPEKDNFYYYKKIIF